MTQWRFGLIAAYVGCSLIGAWVAIYKQAFMGLALFGFGFVCICVHLALERQERQEEKAAQAAWIAEVQRAVDDVGLEDYGAIMTRLEEPRC